MEEVKFLVNDMFSLVDEGVALTGWVTEGVLVPGMRLDLPGKNLEVIRIEVYGPVQLDELDVEVSKQHKKVPPSVVLKDANKKELQDLGVMRGSEVVFVHTN